MPVFALKKKRFSKFISKLTKSYEVIAPVKEDVVKFQQIQDADEIHFEKNSFFPVKEYFFRKQETIFTFDGNKITVPAFKTPSRVFFGIRRCDLNAIAHQDVVFKGAKDPYYTEAREKSILIGYHCDEAPSPYCFCGSLELAEFFDLMFFDKEDYFLVETGSQKGENFVKKYMGLFSKTDKKISARDRFILGADRLEKKDIKEFYDHPDWKKGVDVCLSCSACTNLCPTCYCFELHDEVNISKPSTGERKRTWSSCQVQEFTKVAGDHVFRKDREERFKHRIYHQLQYFKEKNGVDLCVGCGRCVEGCPTRIDFVQILNEMK
ncbi:hypothetical protein GOV09_01740 [Candidatus Woesearchaeota archaeon]|nr:hypothetical protein [Candidatus Woesearchaeota archaeon]